MAGGKTANFPLTLPSQTQADTALREAASQGLDGDVSQIELDGGNKSPTSGSALKKGLEHGNKRTVNWNVDVDSIHLSRTPLTEASGSHALAAAKAAVLGRSGTSLSSHAWEAPASFSYTLGTAAGDLHYNLPPVRDFRAETAKHFEAVVGADKEDVERADFLCILKAQKPHEVEFASMLFAFLERGRSGNVSKRDYVNAMMKLHHGTEHDRLKMLFRIYDEDRSGDLDRSELQKMLSRSLQMTGVQIGEQEVLRMVDAIFEDGDVDESNTLSFIEFEQCMGDEQHATRHFASPSLLNVEALTDAETWLSQLCSTLETYAKNLLIWTFFLIGAGMAFGISFANHSTGPLRELLGPTLPLAKGSAQIIRFVFTLMLFPVSRGLMSFLRETHLNLILPFDDRITMHRICGVVAAVATLVHVAAHCVNYVRWADEGRYHLWVEAFPDEAAHEDQPTVAELWSRSISITGIFMCACFGLALPFALHWPRRSLRFAACFPRVAACLNSFNAFTITHQLLLLMYIGLVLHPPFWKNPDTLCWVGLPVLIYLIDRVRGLLRRTLHFQTQLLSVGILPGRVVELRLMKPSGWTTKPGSYLFIQIPTISMWEWHPFSISSAPDDPYISLHIRKLGDWTGELYAMVEQTVRTAKAGEKHCATGARIKTAASMCLPSVRIDGPYGAPTVGVQQYEVMMLIGAGIGVTPFASVLQDLVYKMRQCEDEEADGSVSIMMKKVYMFVVVATAEEGTWFKDAVESALSFDGGERFEYHLHVTQKAADGTDLAHKRLFSTMRGIYHRSTGRDVVTGMKVNENSQTKMGRPNWEEYFKRVKELHPSTDVGVFFCGPMGLGVQLSKMCRKHSRRDGTRFHYVSESFRV